MKSNSILLYLLLVLFPIQLLTQSAYTNTSYKNYILNNLPDKKEIDVFLNEPGWVKFDPDIGYILDEYLRHDGIDNSYTIVSSDKNGARTSFIYSNKPCRINTYGNSFTQSSQVSDGETWQEYLAAHLGEPVRNYGVGGLGFYQAYKRMLREENTDNSAEYVILYLWGDDHIRSLLRCRYMLIKDWHERHDSTEGIGRMFHGNFWSNIEMDLSSGKLVEKENLISNPDDLYLMTDSNWMMSNLEDDLALQMYLYKQNKIDEIDVGKLEKLSKCLNVNNDLNDKEKLKTNNSILLNKYGFTASQYIIKKAIDFTNENNKKLMIILFDPYNVTRSLIENKPRYDQEIVDFLVENKIKYFDMNLAHVEDYKSFNLSIKDYYNRYFIGHYNPAGNHFFAYSLKSIIVDWLDPKPVTYRKPNAKSVDFDDYLEGIIK